VGPGNTIMDHYLQNHFPNVYYDEDAKLAKTGAVNPDLLNALLADEFFALGFPKTTGPELFSLTYLANAQEKSETTALSHADVMATLCLFTAQTITEAILKVGAKTPKIFMSGGGMHNPLLVEHLKDLLPTAEFSTTAELQINPDAKEAVLFALLANETLAGNPINFGNREGVPSVCMGKICLPN
jgi:anhydro-N-acetylmuramic acid kinase